MHSVISSGVAPMTSAAWWALVSSALALGGEVYTGIAVDAPWHGEKGYELGAYRGRGDGPRAIDFEGRLTRIKQLTPVRNPEASKTWRASRRPSTPSSNCSMNRALGLTGMCVSPIQ